MKVPDALAAVPEGSRQRAAGIFGIVEEQVQVGESESKVVMDERVEHRRRAAQRRGRRRARSRNSMVCAHAHRELTAIMAIAHILQSAIGRVRPLSLD